MMIHEITSKVGRHKKRKRLGRGVGSGHGKTCGRGHKGAGSRSGHSTRASYEGGQMPLFRRIPKRGFSNARWRKDFHVINIRTLEARFNDGDQVTAQRLKELGLLSDTRVPVKVLGEGELTKKLTVVAAAFSASAMDKITKAGGAANIAG